MLIGLRPIQPISSLIQIVKSESTKWIRQQKFCSCQFAWQEGYGAFSYSKSQVSQVILYIQQQELHHRKKTFQEEYINMLTESGIDFDKRYIFKEPIWNVSLFLVLEHDHTSFLRNGLTFARLVLPTTRPYGTMF